MIATTSFFGTVRTGPSRTVKNRWSQLRVGYDRRSVPRGANSAIWGCPHSTICLMRLANGAVGVGQEAGRVTAVARAMVSLVRKIKHFLAMTSQGGSKRLRKGGVRHLQEVSLRAAAVSPRLSTSAWVRHVRCLLTAVGQRGL